MGAHRWQREGNDFNGYTDDLATTPEGKDHETKDESKEHAELERLCIPAPMPVGSILLWSGATIHGACSNTSMDFIDRDDAIRRGLLLVYNLGWLKTEHNWHWSMPADVMAT